MLIGNTYHTPQYLSCFESSSAMDYCAMHGTGSCPVLCRKTGGLELDFPSPIRCLPRQHHMEPRPRSSVVVH